MYAQKNRYQLAVQGRRRAGNFFSVHRADVDRFGLKTASLLGYILNVAQTPGKADKDGWVMMTARFLETGTGMPPDVQSNHLRKLEGAGVLEITWRQTGKGRGRFVRIDLDLLPV